MEKRFPTPELKAQFETAKVLLLNLLSQIDEAHSVPPELLARMEECSQQFRQLCNALGEDTELYGKSAVNEMIHWAEVGYVERTIYFAGLAEGKNIRQPYYTQIQLLPANACLHRFRQCNRIEEQLLTLSNRAAEQPLSLLAQMKESYLYQLERFSEKAFSQRHDHPMSPYFVMLATLLRAHQLENNNQAAIARGLVDNARSLLLAIPRPTEGMHYMHAQYHVMNCDEFASFRRLSEKHADFFVVLKQNAEMAAQFQRDGKVSRPAEYYSIIPYVVLGARASLVGLSALVAAATLLDITGLSDWVSAIWAHAVSAIPGLSPSDAMLIAHTGGVADKFSLLAHTGGVAL